jgi:hypothetical protein
MKRNQILLSVSLIIIFSMAMGLTTSTAQAPQALTQPKVELGEPGLSYRYVETIGETQVPYLADTDHLNGPGGLFMDGSDNLYVAEEYGYRVLKYDSTGTNEWALGKAGNTAWVIGWGEGILINPKDIALDGGGKLWIADGDRVEQYTSDGPPSYLQQFPPGGGSGDDNNHFNEVAGIAFDTSGRMFVSDSNNQRVQVFDLTSGSPVYSTTIGMTGECVNDATHFCQPRRIALDSLDQLYVADSGNNRVQKCTYAGVWSCVTLDPGLNIPQGLAVDVDDNVYIADTENARIRKCDSSGICGDFVTDGWGLTDLAVDSDGNVYGTTKPWEPNFNSVVVEYESSGNWVGIHLGVPNVPYVADGKHYNIPRVSFDADQNILISEEKGERLVKLDPDGNFLWSFGVAGVPGWDNDHLSQPMTVAADSTGKIYVPDSGNCRLQIISPDGEYLNTIGGPDCGGGDYTFSSLRGVAVDNSDNIYVADTFNHRVQIYNSSLDFIGRIGLTGECGSDNDHLCVPASVAVDLEGNIYVADMSNNRVQKFNSNREWQMTIGDGTWGIQFDHLAWPNGVAVDAQGKIYVDEWVNYRVQVFDPSGAYLTTIGGAWGMNSIQFIGTIGVAVDSQGNVYADDSGNHRIQKYTPGVPDWKQVNINGFGNINNWTARDMTVFDNYLYAATSNEIAGGEMWRTADGTHWSQVNQDGFGNVSNPGVNLGQDFNGYLYAGTWNTQTGAEMWRMTTDLTWTQVISGGFGDVGNALIDQVLVFSNTLYATTLNWATGTEVWKSPTGDPGSWTQSNLDGFGDGSNKDVLFAVFNGYLYAATYSWGSTELWRTNDGTSWNQVNTDGFGDPNNSSASIFTFNGYLYALSYKGNTGSQVWRCAACDGSDWTQLGSNVFGEEKNGYFKLGFDGYLFTAVYDDISILEIWRSANGIDWNQVNIDSFGDGNNRNSYYDAAAFHGQLYIGTTNGYGLEDSTTAGNGGEIWRYEPEVSAGFTAAPTVGIAPLVVTFTNTSTGTLTANLWIFGDGATSTDTSPVHTYNTAGVYTVTLVADSFGNKDTITKTSFITVENWKFFLPVVRR